MKFNLGPHTIQVIYEENKVFTSEFEGVAELDDLIIRLDKKLEGTRHDHVLWHEILHSILHHMGKDELKYDEELVHGMSGFIVQVLNTMRENDDKIVIRERWMTVCSVCHEPVHHEDIACIDSFGEGVCYWCYPPEKDEPETESFDD